MFVILGYIRIKGDPFRSRKTSLSTFAPPPTSYCGTALRSKADILMRIQLAVNLVLLELPAAKLPALLSVLHVFSCWYARTVVNVFSCCPLYFTLLFSSSEHNVFNVRFVLSPCVRRPESFVRRPLSTISVNDISKTTWPFPTKF